MREEKKNAIWRMIMDLYFPEGEVEEARHQIPSQIWGDIFQCERSICEKLGVDHCPELDLIMGCYSRLCRQASLRMFKCGILIGEELL